MYDDDDLPESIERIEETSWMDLVTLGSEYGASGKEAGRDVVDPDREFDEDGYAPMGVKP